MIAPRATIDKLAFVVMGQPVPKQSFRKTKNGGYTDPRVKAWQEAVGWQATMEIGSRDLSVGFPASSGVPLEVEIEFHLKDRRVVDLDNLSKAVLDGLKGILFEDDRDVHRLVLTKFFPVKTPHIWVCVSQYTPACKRVHEFTGKVIKVARKA